MKRLFALLALASLVMAACTEESVPTPDQAPPSPVEDSTDEQQTLPTRQPPPDDDAQPVPPEDADQDESIIDPAAPPGPPQIRLLVDGTPHEGYQGSYCWTDPSAGLALCVDKIPPEFDSATDLPIGEPIRLQLDAPLPDTIVVSLKTEIFGESLASQTVQVTETLEWSPNVEPGQYLLTAAANWQGMGDVIYVYSINLAE